MKKLLLTLLPLFMLSSCAQAGKEQEKDPGPHHEEEQPIDEYSTDPSTIKSSKIIAKFALSQNQNPLYEKAFDGKSFTFNQSIFEGEVPPKEDRNYTYEFLGWGDRWDNLVEDNYLIDVTSIYLPYGQSFTEQIGAYVFDGYCYIKNGVETIELSFYPIYEQIIKQHKVTFKNVDGTILDVNYVNVDSFNQQSNSKFKYTGITPKTFDEEGPVKFVGWDKYIGIVNDDIETTAVFDVDDSIDREILMENGYSSGTRVYKNGNYIAAVHNNSKSTLSVSTYAYDTFVKTIDVAPYSSLFFDVTEGIEKVSCYLSNSNIENDDFVYVDYFKNYEIVDVIGCGRLSSSGEYVIYEEDISYKNKDTLILPKFGYSESGNKTPIKKYTLRIPTEINTIFLEGVEEVRFEYSEYYYSDRWSNIYGFMSFPTSIKEISIDREEARNSFANIACDQYYFGNSSNPFFYIDDGKGTLISNYCKVISNLSYRDLFYSEVSTIVIPKSVERVAHIFGNNCNFVFEDFGSIKYIGSFYNCSFKEDLVFPKNYVFEYYDVFHECQFKKVLFHNKSIFIRAPFTCCCFDEIATYGDAENANLVVENNILYSADFSTVYLIPACTNARGQIYVKDGVKVVFDYAISFSSSFGVELEIYLPNSVNRINDQSTFGSYVICANKNASIDPNIVNYIYFCGVDQKRLEIGQFVYALFNDEAYIIDSVNSKISEEILIPDEINVDGVSYPVVSINKTSITWAKIKSASFGKNLRYIGASVFGAMEFNCDLYFPDSLERIDFQNAFYWHESESNQNKYSLSIPARFFKQDICLKSNFKSIEFRCNDSSEVIDNFNYYMKIWNPYNYVFPPMYDENGNNILNKYYLNVGGNVKRFDEITEINTSLMNVDIDTLLEYMPNIKKVNIDMKETDPSGGTLKITFGFNVAIGLNDFADQLENEYGLEVTHVIHLTKEEFDNTAFLEMQIVYNPETYQYDYVPCWIFEDGVWYYHIYEEDYERIERYKKGSYSINLLDGTFIYNIDIVEDYLNE